VVSCAQVAVVPGCLARPMVSKVMQLGWPGGGVHFVCAGGGPFGERGARAAVSYDAVMRGNAHLNCVI